jgi:hypothetical protein
LAQIKKQKKNKKQNKKTTTGDWKIYWSNKKINHW